MKEKLNISKIILWLILFDYFSPYQRQLQLTVEHPSIGLPQLDDLLLQAHVYFN